MTTEVRTPFGTPSAVELSSGGLYRKQILKFGTINYRDRSGKTRRITFDRKYGEDLIRAFREGAYEQVPFQLADADNRHTNDPTRTAGEVVGVELSKDGSGVDGILRLSDKGREVILANPRLGVSARILENAELGGRTFPKALQHVLGTVDPQVRGMSPWQAVESVDLSVGTVSDRLDLSDATYERSAMSGQHGNGDTVTLELSSGLAELLQDPKTAQRLQALLEEEEGLEALAAELEAAGVSLDGGDDEDEDEEADAEDDHGEGGSGSAELSGYVTEAVELANARIESQDQRIVELTNQLAEQRVAAEVDEYSRRGLSPAILELARPLLAVESGAVELSNGVGTSLDPGQLVRDLLDTVIELSGSGHLMLNPEEAERGSLHGSDADQETRKALLADWETNYPH